ncbi:MAG: hypothetical protein HY549_00130 [Elusimicrobia bacterium]|nr:hypothetical protein [Elusimicrobiota bacterium]
MARLISVLLAATALGGFCSSVKAQSPSTSTAQAHLGAPLALDRGPWILGEILFFSAGQPANNPTWRERVRGSRGSLYTRADIFADTENLMSLGQFESVNPALYEIPSTPVPSEFSSISASTNQVRLVFHVTEKPVTGSTVTARPATPPSAISGVIFTPTAYRGAGRYTTPGLGLDFNGVYVIGRLYGKNSFENAPRKTNYIDRVGVWLLTADGKMQLQSESWLRPAVSVGAQGSFLFRDSPQPKVDDPNPSVTVNASQKKTKLLSNAYAVGSKKFGPVRASIGFMQGQQGDMVAQFSEFLTPDALGFFAGRRGQRVRSRSVPFASLLLLPKPAYPLAVEFMKFNGAALNPYMINFKIGYFLKLNFDVALLKFDGGYDVIGLLQFRYNHFPRR